MAYTTEEAQRQLLDALGSATEHLAGALAAFGEAHELLDEQMAERLEEQLFMPVQRSYGRLRRLCSSFAQHSGLPAGNFDEPPRGAPSHGAKGFIEEATEAVRSAERALAELQDSMLPVEVGDAAMRSGLSEVRELLGAVSGSARELLRTFGR